ncbi:uncharacterized protein LOC144153254 [Haemaphysalis longicornis]
MSPKPLRKRSVSKLVLQPLRQSLIWTSVASPSRFRCFGQSHVFEIFEDTAAISDSNGDNILECLLGKRTTIDPDARTATFTWTINPQDGTLSEKAYFWVKAEGEPGHFTVFSNDDPTPRDAVYLYSDYENCLILVMGYNGERCLLGVQRELKDSVPQHCIDRFLTDCGADVPPHSRDLCYDGEGDY